MMKGSLVFKLQDVHLPFGFSHNRAAPKPVLAPVAPQGGRYAQLADKARADYGRFHGYGEPASIGLFVLLRALAVRLDELEASRS
jgi:hypothetical protein